ncbi:hypothetical protein J6590_071713 [Homalodisca vitripennis]|nr:hypothetical protein J6590_071713 [Homalodisca vitripennis]
MVLNTSALATLRERITAVTPAGAPTDQHTGLSYSPMNTSLCGVKYERSSDPSGEDYRSNSCWSAD